MVDINSDEELPVDFGIQESEVGDSFGDEEEFNANIDQQNIQEVEEMKIDSMVEEVGRNQQIGSVYSWGLDACGQLGLKFNQNGVGRIQNKGRGKVDIVMLPSQVKLSSKKNGHNRFTNVFGFGNFSMALTEKGSVYGWGSNSRGQMGDCGPTNTAIPAP